MMRDFWLPDMLSSIQILSMPISFITVRQESSTYLFPGIQMAQMLTCHGLSPSRWIPHFDLQIEPTVDLLVYLSQIDSHRHWKHLHDQYHQVAASIVWHGAVVDDYYQTLVIIMHTSRGRCRRTFCVSWLTDWGWECVKLWCLCGCDKRDTRMGTSNVAGMLACASIIDRWLGDQPSPKAISHKSCSRNIGPFWWLYRCTFDSAETVTIAHPTTPLKVLIRWNDWDHLCCSCQELVHGHSILRMIVTYMTETLAQELPQRFVGITFPQHWQHRWTILLR